MRDGIALFKSHQQTMVLMLIALLEETHASELVRALNSAQTTVRRIVIALEQEGVVAGVEIGRERRLRLNFRYPEA